MSNPAKVETRIPGGVHAEEHGVLRRYIFSTDHKVIGIQYILTGLAMAIIGGALSGLIRLQLGWPSHQWKLLGQLMPTSMNSGVMAPEFYLALVTMHGTIMVFFFISYVLVSGFGNYLIPLQVGARDMAYPFMNMLSYWIGLLAALVMLASFFVTGGAAAAGWTAYPPLSAVATAVPGSHSGQSLWILSMALFIASFTMSSLNFVATIFSLRARGMAMMRMTLTMWSFFISAILGLLAFPPLTAGSGPARERGDSLRPHRGGCGADRADGASVTSHDDFIPRRRGCTRDRLGADDPQRAGLRAVLDVPARLRLPGRTATRLGVSIGRLVSVGRAFFVLRGGCMVGRATATPPHGCVRGSRCRSTRVSSTSICSAAGCAFPRTCRCALASLVRDTDPAGALPESRQSGPAIA
jgi:hypothetical protein